MPSWAEVSKLWRHGFLSLALASLPNTTFCKGRWEVWKEGCWKTTSVAVNQMAKLEDLLSVKCCWEFFNDYHNYKTKSKVFTSIYIYARQSKTKKNSTVIIGSVGKHPQPHRYLFSFCHHIIDNLNTRLQRQKKSFISNPIYLLSFELLSL